MLYEVITELYDRAFELYEQARSFAKDPALKKYTELVLNRYNNPREAYKRIPKYRAEIEDLVRRIEAQKSRVYDD